MMILALGFAALALLLWRSRAASAPDRPQIVTVRNGAAGGSSAGIPGIIWSYWHTEARPLVVERCVHNWQRHNPGYAVRCLHAGNLDEFVESADLPRGFATLSPARQSDVLRLYLLCRHGGIWLDSSIILTRSLDWMLEIQGSAGADYVGFYLERYTERPECPVIDSWCMAAPAGSRFVSDWYAEFSGALERDVDAYVAEVMARPDSRRLLQKIASPGYMAIHVTAQMILARDSDYRLSLVKAEDMAYFYQAWAHWRRLGLFASLLLLRAPRRGPALIKLRGGERRKLEPYLQHGFCRADSIAGRELPGP